MRWAGLNSLAEFSFRIKEKKEIKEEIEKKRERKRDMTRL